MTNETNSMLMSLLPYIIVSIPFAIGNYFVAGKLKKSRPLWVILTLFPFVGIFFNIFVGYIIVLRVIDRLDFISKAFSSRPT
jgi:hypothetical protein